MSNTRSFARRSIHLFMYPLTWILEIACGWFSLACQATHYIDERGLLKVDDRRVMNAGLSLLREGESPQDVNRAMLEMLERKNVRT